MRIIAGKWRGLSLQAPAGKSTRPTTDRVKESMFNLIPHQLEGTVVDLFSGSGALGIEALSRGADRAIFVDKDAKAIATIRKNLERLSNSPDTTVWHMDWKIALRQLVARDENINWVFLDPPYPLSLWQPVIEGLASVDIRGGIVCEVPKNTELPTVMKPFRQTKKRVYGDIAICVYVPEDEHLIQESLGTNDA